MSFCSVGSFSPTRPLWPEVERIYGAIAIKWEASEEGKRFSSVRKASWSRLPGVNPT